MYLIPATCMTDFFFIYGYFNHTETLTTSGEGLQI
jgi:hypothetical protein